MLRQTPPFMPLGAVVSQHFEVVDNDDQLVGAMRHATKAQACGLRDALIKAGHNGALGIAEVTERVTVTRQVRLVAGGSAGRAPGGERPLMAFQPPVFGRQSAPRKPWSRPAGRPDKRKRGRAGQRDRAQVLAEEPLCRVCLANGRTALSTVVDHIIRLADGGSDERSNKQGLCDPCHDEKTAGEQAGDRQARRDV